VPDMRNVAPPLSHAANVYDQPTPGKTCRPGTLSRQPTHPGGHHPTGEGLTFDLESRLDLRLLVESGYR
jgi:hypothetical protein